MALLTPAQLKELNLSLRQKYDKGLAARLPRWNLAELASMETTDQEETIIHWMDRSPLVRDWTGIAKEIANISERGMRVKTRKLELTVGLELAELERGNKRSLKIGLQHVVNGAARYKHDLCVNALVNNGISVDPAHPKPATYVGFDGQPLFGDHPINPDLALAAQVVLPVSKAKVTNTQNNIVTTNPLSPEGWQKARQRARSFRDPRGVNLGVELNTIICPPQLKEAAYEAIGAKIVAVFPTANNGASKENVNATILSDGSMVISWPDLDIGTGASQADWYGIDRNHELAGKAFEILLEKELVFGTNLAQVAALTESQAIKDEQVLFAASGRAVAYATLWFLFVKNRAS